MTTLTTAATHLAAKLDELTCGYPLERVELPSGASARVIYHGNAGKIEVYDDWNGTLAAHEFTDEDSLDRAAEAAVAHSY